MREQMPTKSSIKKIVSNIWLLWPTISASKSAQKTHRLEVPRFERKGVTGQLRAHCNFISHWHSGLQSGAAGGAGLNNLSMQLQSAMRWLEGDFGRQIRC